jgi:cellulose synthase operon protein C
VSPVEQRTVEPTRGGRFLSQPRSSGHVATLVVGALCVLGVVACLFDTAPALAAMKPVAATSEAKQLAKLVGQLRRSKPVPQALATVLAIAELRGALPPEDIVAALQPVAKSWRQHIDLIAPVPVALRELLRAVATDLEPGEHGRWLNLPGAVTAWSYLGPLAHGAGTAFDRADPHLDGALDRSESVAGRDGSVRWRATPPELTGRLEFAALLERPAAAIVYAEAALRTERAATVRLAWLGAGRARLFLDGTQILDHRPTSAATGELAQLSPPRIVQLQLRAGWHTLRVKMQDDTGLLPLAIRVGDVAGKPLVLEQRNAVPAAAGPGAQLVSPPRSPRNVVELSHAGGLLQRGEANDKAAVAALAALRRHRWPGAASEAVTRVLQRNRALSPRVGLAWALSAAAAGDVASRLRQLGQSADPQVLVAHAHALIELDQAAAAHRLHNAFAAANGRPAAAMSVRACNQRVDLWLQLGASTAALAQARLCRSQWPTSPIALDLMARVMMARDHLDMTAHMQERLFRFHPGSARRFLDLLGTMTIRGPPAPHRMHFVSRLLARSAQHRRGWELLARAHVGARNHRRARAALDKLPHWQWRSSTWALSSRIAASLGDTGRAIRDLRVALRAAPSRDDYRARLRRLAPGDRFYRPYQHDLLRLARTSGGTAHPIETLLSQTVIRHDGARQARYDVEVIAIGKGGPTEHEVDIEYVPSQSTVEVLQAAVVKPDGRVLRRATRKLDRVSEDWYGMYYDLEQLTVGFSGLEAGDTIIIQYVARDFAADPFGTVFGELMYLGDTSPIRAIDVVIELPVGTTLHSVAWDPVAAEKLPNQLRPVAARSDRGRRFSAWRLRTGPRPAVALEAAMPGNPEVVPYLHASSFASSAAVSHWYADLVTQALHGADRDPALARMAVKLKGATPRGTVENVFRYASDKIRYVGLEFGIHSLRPHDASEVLARRFGDCKDKATLIVALLRLSGIDAQVALVRTASGGRLHDPIASLGVFDHAIAYIPAHKLWLDATQRHHQMDELPSLDAGGMALRIPLRAHHKPTSVEPLPRSAASKNTRRERRTINLAKNGAADIAIQLRLTGLPAASARGRLHAAATRVERLEEPLSKELPGVKIRDVAVAGVLRPAPVEITFAGAAPELGTAVGNERAIVPIPLTESFTSRLGGGRDRTHDLVLPYAFEDRRQVVLRPPPGWSIVAIPTPLVIDEPYAALNFKCTAAPPTVVCSYALIARQPRITAAQHPSWRAMLSRVDRALTQKVRFSTSGGTR